ncbi:MAG: hypothetical protein IIX01_02550, partial [Clostridia bacterium]|nr:hypothetical protein [Clostridia bacterium]
ISYNYTIEDGKGIMISPAVSLYEREQGKYSVVFCGTPKAPYTYSDGFSFLNESRKKQLVELLKTADALPVYCESDNDLCVRAGYRENGELLVAIINLGFDPEEKITLYLKDAPVEAKLLNKDGGYSAVSYHSVGESLYEFDVKAEPLYPVVILLQ